MERRALPPLRINSRHLLLLLLLLLPPLLSGQLGIQRATALLLVLLRNVAELNSLSYMRTRLEGRVITRLARRSSSLQELALLLAV